MVLVLGVVGWAALQGTARGQGCPDGDGDGVCDADDNCLAVFQDPTQFCDTDHDGYGNLCDSDFDNNGLGGVGGSDLAIFGMNFGDAGELTTDLNCDEMTGIPDWGIINNHPLGPPGPSGLACAGMVPCP